MSENKSTMQTRIEGQILDILIKSKIDNIYLTNGSLLLDKLIILNNKLNKKADNNSINDKIYSSFSKLVGEAPETFDTLKEIADYIDKNDEALDIINKLIESKIDKEEGKGLSTNDFTDEFKYKLENFIDTWRGVIDRLDSTSTTESLSANKGRELNDSIESLMGKSVSSIEGVYGLRFYDGTLCYKGTDGQWHSTFKESDPPKVTLKTPTNVIIESGDEEAKLSWTDPEDIIIEDITFAEWDSTIIIRKEGSAPTNENDGTVVLKNTVRNKYTPSMPFIDTGLTNGKTYYYGIFPRTTNIIYNYSYTDGVIPKIIYPSKATNLSVVAGDEEAKLTFDIASDVNSYKVVYKEYEAPTDVDDGTIAENFSSGNTIYGLTNDITYYFTVFTYNSKGRESMSSSISCTPKISYPPKATNLSVTAGDEEAKLTFTIPSGVDSYKVVYEIGQVPNNSSTEIPSYTSGKTISNLQNDYTYFFRIYTYNAKGRETASDTVYCTPKAVYPSAATNLSVSLNSNNSRATLTFTMPSNATYAYAVMKKGSAPSSSTDGSYNRVTSGSTSFSIDETGTYYFKVFTFNNKGRSATSGTVSKTVEFIIVSFSNGSDAEISAMLDAHYAGKINISDYWSVGDTRQMYLSATLPTTGATMPHGAQKMTFVILGFDHDKLSTSKGTRSYAAVTIQCREALYSFNETDYVTGTDEIDYVTTLINQPIRTYLSNTFINSLPSTFNGLVKSVSKSYDGSNVTDKGFLLSYSEVCGSEYYEYYNKSYPTEGKQYPYFVTKSKRRKNYNDNGSAGGYCNWWLRSISNNYNSTYNCLEFILISMGNNVGTSINDRQGICPAFCI